MTDRAKIFGTLETLVIGAAGVLLFLWVNLPGGLISGAMVAVEGYPSTRTEREMRAERIIVNGKAFELR